MRSQRLSLPRRGKCGSGKVGYRSFDAAKYWARHFSRQTLAGGRFIETMYAYRCPTCPSWHLTRLERFDGVCNAVAYIAPGLDAQLWAMPEEKRAEAEAALMADVRTQAEEAASELRRMRYANRPRGLSR